MTGMLPMFTVCTLVALCDCSNAVGSTESNRGEVASSPWPFLHPGLLAGGTIRRIACVAIIISFLMVFSVCTGAFMTNDCVHMHPVQVEGQVCWQAPIFCKSAML